jgi:MFS family permease
MILAASLSLYLFSEGNPIIFYIGFALLWLNLGGWITLAPTTTKMFFGAKNYGKNYGIVITADGVGALLGPLSSGWLRDTTGTYLSVFPLVAALAVVGAITMLVGLKRGD